MTVLCGCSPTADGPSGARPTATSAAPGTVRLPPADAVFDYQLGGAYPPRDDVRVVSRDRTAQPAEGRYSVCYVNAFQTQPGAAVGWWRHHHPELLLHEDGDDGPLVIDEDWDEPLLDVSTSARRAAAAEVVGRWIDGCATAGFDAVEADNLDSYERSGGRLDADDAAAFARLLARRAHARGLAFAQKNTAGLLGERDRIGFDFAVTEECARYRECDRYLTAYDGRVLDIEYRTQDFTTGCRHWGDRLSLTLRDRDVRPEGEHGYVYRHC
ncbi:endo alpha-1,4 polygalactosaminidase [Streptomyces benahoarensis]|uniref:Endo alpha-1,4 polygalactosaminidase n=1 Tax=Streptomyces benahoarensis TaxID=2595054 RepID=A0A553XL19_9ACTN|nr:endo alpha-1,4 polygalactosaminidase [Streptomyces benahoarensis]TSB17670.1 endo alpha-1,4 polygalactosaminidase [Streptomyces benahoarensis]